MPQARISRRYSYNTYVSPRAAYAAGLDAEYMPDDTDDSELDDLLSELIDDYSFSPGDAENGEKEESVEAPPPPPPKETVTPLRPQKTQQQAQACRPPLMLRKPAPPLPPPPTSPSTTTTTKSTTTLGPARKACAKKKPAKPAFHKHTFHPLATPCPHHPYSAPHAIQRCTSPQCTRTECALEFTTALWCIPEETAVAPARTMGALEKECRICSRGYECWCEWCNTRYCHDCFMVACEIVKGRREVARRWGERMVEKRWVELQTGEVVERERVVWLPKGRWDGGGWHWGRSSRVVVGERGGLIEDYGIGFVKR